MGMKLKMTATMIALFLGATSVAAQRHEVGLTAGIMKPGESGLSLVGSDLGNSFAFQIDYSARVLSMGIAAMYLDVPLALATKTNFETSNAFSLRSYSSLFFTPGFKLKLLPSRSVSPYVVAGIGFARLNPSAERINGNPVGDNAKVDNAYSIGGGVDIKVAPRFSIRGEVRDYNTGTPDFEANLLKKRQHNLFATGGVVIRF